MPTKPNLNLRKRVLAGEVSVEAAKAELQRHAGPQAESTSTWKWLCRRGLA